MSQIKPVYISGTFDLFHVGHLEFLLRAREYGDHLTVALNTDEYVASYKRLPIIPYWQREIIVAQFADEVGPRQAINDWSAFRHGPGIRVVGQDNGRNSLNFPGQVELKEMGIKEVYIPRNVWADREGTSTSQIIDRVIDRYWQRLLEEEPVRQEREFSFRRKEAA